MNILRHGASAALAMVLAQASCAFAAAPAPPFDVAYRAWETVTELARQHRDASISGECGKTFRPFVIPGLRRQTAQEEDVAAAACVAAARTACTSGKLRRSAEIERKCGEFR
jgi:hypothetical protein